MAEPITEPLAFNNIPGELSLEDVAYLLSVSIQTIKRMVEDKEIEVHEGSILRDDFFDFLERHYIVNMPIFTPEENVRAYLKEHEDLPEFINQDLLLYLLNEIPEELIAYKGLSRDEFILFLAEKEHISYGDVRKDVIH